MQPGTREILNLYLIYMNLFNIVANFFLYPIQTKLDTNEENRYNQNFDGVYCTCARPYPDPEDTTGDEMLQCVMCEDWYHSKVRL